MVAELRESPPLRKMQKQRQHTRRFRLPIGYRDRWETLASGDA